MYFANSTSIFSYLMFFIITEIANFPEFFCSKLLTLKQYIFNANFGIYIKLCKANTLEFLFLPDRMFLLLKLR